MNNPNTEPGRIDQLLDRADALIVKEPFPVGAIGGAALGAIVGLRTGAEDVVFTAIEGGAAGILLAYGYLIVELFQGRKKD